MGVIEVRELFKKAELRISAWRDELAQRIMLREEEFNEIYNKMLKQLVQARCLEAAW